MTAKTFIKRRYYEFRMGNQMLSPVLQLGNFLMLAYLTINEVIPFYLFVPLFVLTVLASMTFVGSKFRSLQLSTDINIAYEKSTYAGVTTYHMMKAINDIKPQDEEFLKRMDYVKRIGEGKV